MVAQSSSSSSSRSSSIDQDNSLKASLKSTKANSSIIAKMQIRRSELNPLKKSNIAKAIVPFMSLADSVKRMN